MTIDMKAIITTLVVLILGGSGLFAQRNNLMNNPKIEQLRIAFFTEKIGLTPAEAEKFWPLYKQYRKELEMAKGKMGLKMQEIMLSMGSVSDSELEKLTDEMIGYKRKETEVFEAYYPKFKAILPIEKVVKFYRAEAEFPRWLLKQSRQHQGNPRRGN